MSQSNWSAADVTVDDRPGGDRDPLDHLAEEFSERCRRGEAPSISEYEARHPEQADRVRKLLGAVSMMEQLRRVAPPSPSMPDRLGEFRIIRELGRGGMGVVYEAVQESLGRHVAVKALSHAHQDAKRLQRFRIEAQAVARLHHTNIVPIFGVGEHDGQPFYAMQYIRGIGLDAILGRWRQGERPESASRWAFVARVGLQAAGALQYAHEQGVLHRDIKPANILIDCLDRAWITDFGLAKLSGREELTASGDVIGTLRYLAPESLRGETDARSDVYSLGLTLYELATLNPPYGELNPSELLRRVSEGHPTSPRRIDPSIPPDLETIILKAIAPEPAGRYATSGDLGDDLLRFLEDRPIQARRATAIERARRWSRRNPLAAMMAGAAVGSLMLGTVVGWWEYARANRALQRSEANVALSLEIFGEVFEKLAAEDFVPAPPLGLVGPDSPVGDIGQARRRPGRDFSARPGPPPDDEPPGFNPGPPGFDHGPPGRGPGPFPGGGPGGDIGGPGRPGDASRTRNDLDLLQSILSFYDRFARLNDGNPTLLGEAAWAYRKVGAVYDRFHRADDAELAYARAIAMFEELAARQPGNPQHRFRLVATVEMANPRTAPDSTLGRLESRLRRADALIDGLVVESPDDLDYAQSQVQVKAKLALLLRRSGRLDESEALLRRSIQLEGEWISRATDPDRPLLDRATTREDLALLRIDRGHPEEAGPLLGSAADDLMALSGPGRSPPPPTADRLESVAAAYRKLGDENRAREMDMRAVMVRARSFGPRGKRDEFGPGPRRGGPDRPAPR